MQNENILPVENPSTLSDFSIEIDISHFINIRDLIYQTFKKSKINPENKYIYYQRNENGTSILAIQITDGEYTDLSNFMINGSTVNYYSDDISCDVYLHADAKSSQNSLVLARLISRPIVEFFEELERELLLKDMCNISFSLRIPLYEKELNPQNKGIKNLLKKIFS